MKLSWSETNLGDSHSRSGSGKMGCSATLPTGGATNVKATLAFSRTPADGARPLLTFNQDLSQAVANIATDGVDLVWVHGKDRTDGTGNGPYPKADLMTAPFTTDPAALAPKRLRSFPSGYIWTNSRNAVGCGYAAYYYVPAANEGRLMIVRLSDGVSWSLLGPADKHWKWGPVVAVTCDEVFVTWNGLQHLRRIRLDSLGPGQPPD